MINTPQGSGAARARTATRSAAPPSPPTSRASPPCRAPRPRSWASRRCIRGEMTRPPAAGAARRPARRDRGDELRRLTVLRAAGPAGAVPDRRRRRRGGARVDAAPAGRAVRPAGGAGRAARAATRVAAPRDGVRGATSPTRSGWPPGWTRTAWRCRPGPRSGFGFVEVGTVTAHAQPGNDRPRLFRLPGQRGGDQPDGLQQRRRGGAGRPAGARWPARWRCRWASAWASPR